MDTAYNFQWNLFEFHLINSNRELYKEKHFADVTLVSEDMKKFKAHKTVLGTASTILKEVFLAKPDQKVTILLKGIMEKELAQVLKFVYLGEAVVDEDRIEHFEMAAKYLKIKVLEEMTSEMKKKHGQKPLQTPNANLDENTLYVGFNSDENTIYIDPSLNQNIFANLETNYGIIDHNGSTTDNGIEVKPNIQNSRKSENKTCKFCGKTFSRAWSLQFHIESVHEGVRYNCQACNFVTTKKNLLAKHEEKYHPSSVVNSASIASMLFPVKREGI